MQDLFGRVRLLDPTVSEGVKVITYFDTMLESGSSVDELVRGAAMLAGASVGFETGGKRRVFAADGLRITSDESGRWATAEFCTERGRGWLQRFGAAHANDQLVLERLLIAIGLSTGRVDSKTVAQQSIGVLLAPDRARTTDDVLLAATRLRLDPGESYRAVASRISGRSASGGMAAITTPWGLVRASVVRADAQLVGAIGVGVAEFVHSLTRSWESALFALRANRGPTPLVADELGIVYELARHVDGGADTPPDVRRVCAALEGGWLEAELFAVAEGATLRAVASIRGLHHSTVAAKYPDLLRQLGFDPFASLGRTRLHIALILRRVELARFDTGY